ncbi:MAG: DNA-packaging protein [Allosphingosinicella sp.]
MSEAARRARLLAFSDADKEARLSLIERIALLEPERQQSFTAGLPARLRKPWLLGWAARGRPAQLAPDGDWRVWLIQGGRGYGKTRAGAEWVNDLAETAGLRIALVGPTEEEARAVMVEGPSGVLATAMDWERPQWEPSLGRLTWPGGTIARVYSAANPEALRGPEHDFAWCDEIAKWPRGEAAWDNLILGLRRGERPRVLATTTPKPVPLMRRLVDKDGTPRPGVAVSRGRTVDNLMLAEAVVDNVTDLYGGTRLGRQELDGELIEEVEGSLWPRALIEACRVPLLPGTGRGIATRSGVVEGAQLRSGGEAGPLHRSSSGPPPRAGEDLRRVVVGVDPPASVGGDACGIVVCGLGADGVGYVLGDASVAGLRPEGWAAAVAHAAASWRADRVIAEGNQGGAMVESVLRSVESGLPVRIVHARHGKSARAEPVASLFETGRARFAGIFPELEDQLTGLTIGGGYEGPGRSPDRADAMVWAMTELMLGRQRGEPRIRQL